MFDMTKCKIGDKVVTREGDVLIYIGYSKYDTYPYKLDGDFRISVLPNGSEYESTSSDNDIVGFADEQPTLEQSVQAPSTTISIRKEERYFITVNDTEVELTIEELYNLQHQINKLVGEE